MNNRTLRRVCALEGETRFFTIGELLDCLGGAPLPISKDINPALVEAFKSMGAAKDA